ncbi:hypothetical protein CCR75_004230 [Bremia lactucae]|uniref:Ubiquitinyl hydrolase 1 n=1 Tax=Bremia lactucae TaxID=4779 RepID=A0A976IGJ2_BRELC|nr:hypothetical protein CCR75_004230 [Bremia lactucae]
MRTSHGGGSFRHFFLRRHDKSSTNWSQGASSDEAAVGGATAQPSLITRTRLLDSWSLSELFALRELVHVAINNSMQLPDLCVSSSALQRVGHSDEPTRSGTCSSTSSSATFTSATPPSVASVDELKWQEKELQMHLDLMLGQSKRFYFSRPIDTRLRLDSRRQFVRLFPLLKRTSRGAQRLLFRSFDANNTGKVEFIELCEMLAKVRQAKSFSVREMAKLAFSWLLGDKKEPVLTYAEIKLLAVTVAELETRRNNQSEHSHEVLASLVKLVLDEEQHHVTKQTFCHKMNCQFGAHVLHVLFTPFGVVSALFDEGTLLREVENTRWKAGDTAYVTSRSWWTQWLLYVQSCHYNPDNLHNQSKSNLLGGQETGEQQVHENDLARQQQLPHLVECHPRPGPIANREICANERLGTLKPHLLECDDYVLVSNGIWKRLVQIYGGGPEFPRQVIGTLSSDEEVRPRAQVELYPVALQIRLAQHDSRHVYLVYARRFLLPRCTFLKEILHRLGIFPGINAREISLWIRRRRLQSWARLKCSLDAPYASLEGLQITSSQELLVDFRALQIDEDPQSIAQQRRRINVASFLPRKPFAVAMLQPVGNDFLCCPRSSLAKFARTGNWKVLRENTAAKHEAAANLSSALTHSNHGRVLVGLMKHMETTPFGRLVQHDGLRATGLVNIGNTCFMNSALQCFVHSPVFREYFLSNRFEADVNKKNLLGSRGAVAAAFAQLQGSVWRERTQGYKVPDRFRHEFIRVRRHFEETRQYDAHEFMVALLDCLHEDLNQGRRSIADDDAIQLMSSRCLAFNLKRHSPGREIANLDNPEATQLYFDEDQGNAAWRQYTSVNSSVVVDLFHGQMRNETICGSCGERKCTFDPNLFFSLPIPELNFIRVEVSILMQARTLPNGLSDEYDPEMALQAVQRGFWLRRGSNVKTLCDRIAAVYGRGRSNRFLLVEVHRHRIGRIVEGDEVVNNLMIVASGSLVAYERAWTLAEIPSIPVSVLEYFSGNFPCNASDDAKPISDKEIKSFVDLRVGSRVVVRDHHAWHPGTIIEVDNASENDAAFRDHRRVFVHFDAFRSKWNKWFTARDWKSKRLQFQASRLPKSIEVFEVQVVHRFQVHPVSEADRGRPCNDNSSFLGDLPSSRKLSTNCARECLSLEVFGMPLFVTIASDKSAQDLHKALLLQTARFWKGFPAGSGSTDSNHREGLTLPYQVHVVNLDDLCSERGEPLPMDSSSLLQYFTSRSVVALDWSKSCDYFSSAERAPDDIPPDVAEAALEDPDLRALLEANHSNKTSDGIEAAIDDETSSMYAVPLAKCMDALMREEAISLEDHWICEHCGVPREGTRLSAIWRLPDLVMVQLKRFEYLDNEHKHKVRALVDFPIQGLNFSKWMGHQDSHSQVYDLYAVANHVGGLAQGHYTAYCRYDRDFPESSALFRANDENLDVQCHELWFRFDDDKVSEIAVGDVVTDAAYVLFYKRRTLSSTNVLRYAL